jgi:O-antigen/teichoic acid export membrane protein
MAVAVLLIPVVSAKLPPADAGLWFAFQGLIAMIGLIDLGFGFAISRQASYTLQQLGDTKTEGDFLRLSPGAAGTLELWHLTRKLYLGMVLSGTVLALLAYELLSRHGNLLSGHEGDIRWVWYLVACAFLVSFSAGGHAAILNGIGNVYQTRLLAAFYQVVAGAGAAVMAFSGAGLVGMGASFAISAVLYRIAMAWLLKRNLPAHPNGEHPRAAPGALKKLAAVAMPVGLVSIFASLVYAIQTPLLGSILGPEKIVPFYLAQRIGQAFNMAAAQLVLPYLPFFTMKLGAGDKQGALEAMTRNLKKASLMLLGGTIAFFLLSPWMARFLLHKSNYVDVVTLSIMSLDFLLLGLTGILGQYVLASGRKPFVWSTVLTGMSSLGLSYLLTNKLGVVGLPCATLIAGLLFNYRECWVRGRKLRSDLLLTS